MADPKRALDLLGDLITGASVAGLVGLGVRLGLYPVMAGQGTMDSREVAAAAGLDERWVREWLFGQAAAGVLDHAGGDGFELTDGMAALLADPGAVLYMGAHFRGLPLRLGRTPTIEEAFRTGRGLSFDEQGQGTAADIEALFANWFRHLLVPVGLAALDGVVERLEAGTRVADVGCGAGVAVIEIARAFPRSEVHGFDVSREALERAGANLDAAGLPNAHFHDLSSTPLAAHHPYGLVTTFDCLHDMTDPGSAVSDMRAAIAGDGAWMVSDIACGDSFEDNLARPRLASMLYATSVFSCLPAGLSEPGGAGLGTCGLPASALERLGREHGFTSFRRLPIDHPINAFYELRP